MEDAGGSGDVMVVNADDLVVGIEDGGPTFSDDDEDDKNDSEEYVKPADVTEAFKAKKKERFAKRNSASKRTASRDQLYKTFSCSQIMNP